MHSRRYTTPVPGDLDLELELEPRTFCCSSDGVTYSAPNKKQQFAPKDLYLASIMLYRPASLRSIMMGCWGELHREDSIYMRFRWCHQHQLFSAELWGIVESTVLGILVTSTTKNKIFQPKTACGRPWFSVLGITAIHMFTSRWYHWHHFFSAELLELPKNCSGHLGAKNACRKLCNDFPAVQNIPINCNFLALANFAIIW